MKRLLRDGRVLYVRRHYGLSLLLIGISLSIMLYARLFPSPEKKELGIALYYAVPFALAATIATLRSQMVAIDRERGRVLFVDRQLFRAHRKFRDLARLSVRLKSLSTAGGTTVHHYIWIDVAEDGSVLFRMQHGGGHPLDEARRLASDLGRPLIVE